MATSRAGVPLPAFVLHQYDWSESSLIVELFTRPQGRVVVAAKGAKRPTSNFRPVLMPFQPLVVQLGKPPKDEHSEVLNLRSAEWAGGQALLRAGAMFAAFYANELLLKLLPRQDAHPALFDAYAATLSTLAAGGDEAPALRAFELQLLRELGWLPDLSLATLTGEALVAERRYALDAEAGLVGQTAAAAGLPGRDWAAVEAALATDDMPALQAACAATAGALRTPLRRLLHYHLNASPLRTRDVRQGVQRLLDTR